MVVSKEHKRAYDKHYHLKHREARCAKMREYMARNWLERKYARIYKVGIPEARKLIRRDKKEGAQETLMRIMIDEAGL